MIDLESPNLFLCPSHIYTHIHSLYPVPYMPFDLCLGLEVTHNIIFEKFSNSQTTNTQNFRKYTKTFLIRIYLIDFFLFYNLKKKRKWRNQPRSTILVN